MAKFQAPNKLQVPSSNGGAAERRCSTCAFASHPKSFFAQVGHLRSVRPLSTLNS
jgi:hypothetical protein